MSQLIIAQTYRPVDSSIANGLVQTLNGDYVLAGRTFTPEGESAAIAIRTDPAGNVIWQRVYSSPFTVFLKAVTQIAGGDLVASGSFFFSEAAGDEFIWVVRLDPLGIKVWEAAFGTTAEQSDGEDVAPTADGGFVVTGLFLEKATGLTGTRVLKFGPDNEVQWDKRFETGVAHAVRQTRDGGYILSGAHMIPGSLNSNPYILRLDAEGSLLWEQVYTDFEIYVLQDSAIVETDTGDFIAVFKSLVMKIDCCGQIIWAHQSGALNLGTVTLSFDRLPVAGGSLIVNNFDHAYVAALGEEGEAILWDNTEIAFPSGVTQVILNREGFIAATGYLPADTNLNQMFLAVYNPARTIV